MTLSAPAAGIPPPPFFCSPVDLFQDAEPARTWTCVRTRPRWEKKFMRWLQPRGLPYFLPLICRHTASGRKERVNWLPLFPGYVFVAGDHSRQTFSTSDSVVYLLKPSGAAETAQLHEQLRGIWRTLTLRSPLELARPLAAGDPVEIISGPLRGVQGNFQRWKKRGVLLLAVSLIGSSFCVEIPESWVLRPLP